jgi:hypothetical protein
MSSSRDEMIRILRLLVVPRLRDGGFKGSFPHFRRPTMRQIDLLTFQFDRNGGGFVTEIACCPLTGLTRPWGLLVPPNKVRAWDVNPPHRPRLPAREGKGTEGWFRYEDGQFELCATQLLAQLPKAEEWWLSQPQKSHH